MSAESAIDAQGFKPIHADIRKLLDEAADHLRGRCSMDGGDADDSADFIEEVMDRHDQMVAEIERLRTPVEYDNHHNALVCPYCNPDGHDTTADALKGKVARQELEIKRLRERVAYVDKWAELLDLIPGEKFSAETIANALRTGRLPKVTT